MSQRSPLTSMFAVQRTVLEQSHRATRQTVEAQMAAFDAFVDAAETSRSFGNQTAKLSRQGVHATLDALATMDAETDVEEVREAFDEQFAAGEEARESFWTAMTEAMDDGNAAFDEFADQYLDVVDRSFDAYLDAHDQTRANVRSVADEMSDD